MKPGAVSTCLWVALLLVAAVGLTIAGFYTFITPEHRGPTFYSVITSICVAELILFGYIIYMIVVPQTVTRPSPAVRMRIMLMVTVWFLVILISGLVAVQPSVADRFSADKLIFSQLVLTFLLLFGAYFLHRQDVALQMRSDQPQRERVQLQSYAGGIQDLLGALRAVGVSHPDHSAELDRLLKRMDTLKTEFLSASPAAERPMGRMVEPVSVEEIEQHLRALRAAVQQLTASGGEQLPGQIAAAGQIVDGAIASLRHRDSAITF